MTDAGTSSTKSKGKAAMLNVEGGTSSLGCVALSCRVRLPERQSKPAAGSELTRVRQANKTNEFCDCGDVRCGAGW